MNFSISIVDYIGLVQNGISCILSLNVDDKYYEIIYWFNIKDYKDARVVVDTQFLIDFKIVDIYKYEYFDVLVMYIDSVLPDKKELIKKFS